jgi:hypothetical protein
VTDDIDELRSTLAHLDLALEYDPQNLELLHARADLVAAIGPWLRCRRLTPLRRRSKRPGKNLSVRSRKTGSRGDPICGPALFRSTESGESLMRRCAGCHERLSEKKYKRNSAHCKRLAGVLSRVD